MSATVIHTVYDAVGNLNIKVIAFRYLTDDFELLSLK